MEVFSNIPIAPPRHARSFRKVGRWCLFAIAFLTPFFFLPLTEDPAGINKLVAIAALAIVAFVCFLGCVLEERRIEYPHSWLALAILVFILMQGISAWFSIAPAQSFWGNLDAPDSLLSFILLTLTSYLFFFFFRRDDLKKLAIAAGVGLLIGTFSDPAWGIMIATVIAMLAVVHPDNFGGRKKFIFFAVAILALTGLIALNYQFLWLALALFVIIVAALRFEPREHFHYAFAIIIIALFFALIGVRLPMLSGAPKDLRPGVSATLTVAQGILTGPAMLIGSGPATFSFDFQKFRPASINTTSFWSMIFGQGHDFAATLLSTGGLLGFLLFLIIVFLAIQPFLHLHSLDVDIAMVASGATFIMASLFWYPASFAEFIILFALLGMLASEYSRRVISFDALSRGTSLLLSLVVLVCVAFSLAGMFFLGEQYVAAILFQQSNELAAAGSLDQAFAKVNTAYNLNHTDEYLRAASQILLSETRVLAASSDPNASAELPAAIANAVQAGQNAMVEDQQDPANWGNLGSIYEAVMPVANGADQLAVGSYQNAANLDPENPQWDLDIGRTLMESAALLVPNMTSANSSTIQTDWTNAEAALQKAIALKDDYADPRVLLVQLYLQEGNIAQAIEKVQELKAQNPLDPGVAFELGYLYYESGQMNAAQEEFQVATILDPNYSNARYFLGLIYNDEGMTAQALAQFQKIQNSNPDNAQIRMIIANLEAGQPALANSTPTSTLIQPAKK